MQSIELKNRSLVPDSRFVKKFFAVEEGAPCVFVTTWYKHVMGTDEGEWINLLKVMDFDEFLEACAAIHQDEENPDFFIAQKMNWDYDIHFISDWDEEEFTAMKAEAEWDFLENSEAFEVYEKVFPNHEVQNCTQFRVVYVGKFESMEDFYNRRYKFTVESQLGALAPFFSKKNYIRGLFKDKYIFSSGYVFNRI